MYWKTKLIAARPTSRTSSGPTGSVCVVIVLSTIARCTSGMIEVMTWPRMATPKAISTLFLWRTRNGHSFRIQPGSVGFFIAWRRLLHRHHSLLIRAARSLALGSERAGELRERVLDDRRVAHVGEEGVEPLAHRTLGDSQRRASSRGDGEPDRAPVAVDGGALHEPVGDQRLDRGRDRGSGERELAGEAARPLLAAAR